MKLALALELELALTKPASIASVHGEAHQLAQRLGRIAKSFEPAESRGQQLLRARERAVGSCVRSVAPDLTPAIACSPLMVTA